MPTETIKAGGVHTCSYACERPECIRAQRDELASRVTAPPPAAARGDVRGLVAKWREEAAAYVAQSNEEDSSGGFLWAGWVRDELRAKSGVCKRHADELEAALAAEGVQAGEVECDCPGKGKDDPVLHAPNCPARLPQQPEARGVPLEPAEKPVAWWNGISPDKLGRDWSVPSVRWGADAEDSGHDIPLFAGHNPIHYVNPDAMAIIRELAKLRDGLDNSNSSAEEYAARLAHRAAALTGERNG